MFGHIKTNTRVKVIDGPHAGREGNVVSSPWLGNLWHTWLTVNTSANEKEILERFSEGWGSSVVELVESMRKGHGPRTWLKVHRKNLKVI